MELVLIAVACVIGALSYSAYISISSKKTANINLYINVKNQMKPKGLKCPCAFYCNVAAISFGIVACSKQNFRWSIGRL